MGTLNYQDQILQLAEQLREDILSSNEIITTQQDANIKKLLEDSVLPFVNNYLTDLYVQTEQIGFSDTEQISEFITELDINLHTLKLEAMGVIATSDEAGHFYLTDFGKRIAQQYEEE